VSIERPVLKKSEKFLYIVVWRTGCCSNNCYLSSNELLSYLGTTREFSKKVLGA
jgi:hypothetical protein